MVLFSYGSGLASSMFALRFSQQVTEALETLQRSVADITQKLEARLKVPPSEFEKTMKLREETHHLGKSPVSFGGIYMLFNPTSYTGSLTI